MFVIALNKETKHCLSGGTVICRLRWRKWARCTSRNLASVLCTSPARLCGFFRCAWTYWPWHLLVDIIANYATLGVFFLGCNQVTTMTYLSLLLSLTSEKRETGGLISGFGRERERRKPLPRFIKAAPERVTCLRKNHWKYIKGVNRWRNGY